MKNRAVHRILLFKIGAIGDVLLTTPLVRSLRTIFPNAQIDYLTGAWSAPALQNNPHINSVIEFDDEMVRRRNISRLLNLAAQIRHCKYDVVLVLDPGWQAGLLATFFGSFRIGFGRNGEGKFHHQAIPFEETTHDSLQYLKLGKPLGASSNDTALEFFPSPAHTQFAQEVLKNIANPRVAICPGGAENPYQILLEKRWPAEYYRQLLQALESKNYSVVICGGPNDKEIAEKIASPKTLNLAGQTTLAQAAAVLRECDLVVAQDSGLMHLAAALGTPTLTLFGPTDPRRLAPLGKQHRVIWKAAYACYQNGKLHNCTPAHDMRAISISEVLAEITSSTVIART